MRISRWSLLAAILSAGCSSGSRHLTAAQAAEIDRGVRAFAREVAAGVTLEGPAAWGRYFSESPEFFMAAEGRLAFPNGASARAALPEVARAIEHIELQWEEELRVDPLAPDLAGMAVPYHEIRTGEAGGRVDEHGYFTGTVERKGGRWRLRNAHWSAVVPLPSVR